MGAAPLPADSTGTWSTRILSELTVIISLLFGLGFVLCNPILIQIGIAFAVFILLDAASLLFVSIEADTRVSASTLRRGDDLEIVTDMRLSRGIGIIHLLLPLPNEFEIKDGTNYRVFFALPWPRRERNTMTVTAHKRGEYVVGPAVAKAVSLWGAFCRSAAVAEAGVKIAVRPRQHLIRRLKELKALGKKPFPENSIVFLGMRSNSFKELREYRPGDLVRWINWRASARAFSGGVSRPPLVNEYETEGKKVVWIFMDDSSSAAVGTDTENVFEYFLDAALTITSYFVSRGYKVGLSVLASNILIRSDHGKGQIAKILREFMRAEYVTRKGDLVRAVESTKPFLASERPLCFFLTRPEVAASETRQAILRVRTILGHWSRIFLLTVDWTVFHPEHSSFDAFAAKVMGAKIRNALALVRKSGATPILWDPKKQRLGELLTRIIAASGATRN